MGRSSAALTFVTPFLSPRAHPSYQGAQPFYPPKTARRPFVAALAKPASPPSSASPDSNPESPPPPPQDVFESTSKRLQDLSESVFESVFTPISSSCSVLSRRWQTKANNFILHPTVAPKAVFHFLGGAFFAAAPHILYRTFLERLCERGYVIVATAYEIGFDHLGIAAEIAENWERVEQDLALQYGEIPVIGVGHSAGALFHVLMGSLFEEATPRVGNVLVSYSNREVGKAIPGYRDVVRPAVEGLVGWVDGVGGGMRDEVEGWVGRMEGNVVESAWVPRRVKSHVMPSMREGGRVVTQVWGVLEEIAGKKGRGEGEFYPGVDEVRKAVEKLYGVQENLVVTYRGDFLDDSGALVGAMRHGVTGDGVQVVEMAGGGHLTPLGQELGDLGVGGVSGLVREGVNAVALRELMALEQVVVDWVEKGIESGKL
eukprot:GFKZ01005153.1.p1 GENE.GFKZ01005153.1~~GFKZ01005153.1.p1  ORF type:complete len:483 (-),score=62.25 GFKZ01005153.1:330-1619(-)